MIRRTGCASSRFTGLSGMSSGNAVRSARVQLAASSWSLNYRPATGNHRTRSGGTTRQSDFCNSAARGESRAFSRSVDLVRLQGNGIWKGRPLPLAPEVRRNDGRPLMEEVARHGRRERILSVRHLSLEGTGENYNSGRILRPKRLSRVRSHGARRSIDFANSGATRAVARAQSHRNTAAQRTRLGYDSVAFDICPTELSGVPRSRRFRARQRSVYHPIGFLRSAGGQALS